MASDLQCRGSYLTGSPGCCAMTFITGWCRGRASRNEAEWVTDAGLLLGEMDASDGGFGRPQWLAELSGELHRRPGDIGPDPLPSSSPALRPGLPRGSAPLLGPSRAPCDCPVSS